MEQRVGRGADDLGAGYSLADAITETLKYEGTHVLLNPEQMLAYVYDFADCDSPMVQVFLRLCSRDLLLPLSQYANGQEDALGAKARIQTYLTGSCIIELPSAQLIAESLVRGVSSYIGDDFVSASHSQPNVDEPADPGPKVNSRANTMSDEGRGASYHSEGQFAVDNREEPIDGASKEPSESTIRHAGGVGRWLGGHKLFLLFLALSLAILGFVFIPHAITHKGSKALTASFVEKGAESEIDSLETDEDGVLILPEMSYARDGYQFVGWSIQGDSEIVAAGKQVKLEEPTTFVANWRPVATFVGGGAAEGKMEPLAAGDDGSIALPECTFKRADCTFVGWINIKEPGTKWDRETLGYPTDDLVKAGDIVTVTAPVTYSAVWEYGDQITGQVSVEPIFSGDTGNGFTSGVLLRVTNNSPYTLDLGCTVRATDRLFCVAPGQSSLAFDSVFGSQDWSQYNPKVSAYTPLKGWSSLEGEYRITERTVEQGKLEIEVTNTGNKRLHICKACVLGEADGSLVLQNGSRDTTEIIQPGESFTTGFGRVSNDDTQWNQYNRSYNLYGFAEDIK